MRLTVAAKVRFGVCTSAARKEPARFAICQHEIADGASGDGIADGVAWGCGLADAAATWSIPQRGRFRRVVDSATPVGETR
jgi:hypothetical protein